jgi:hypothetical protein
MAKIEGGAARLALVHHVVSCAAADTSDVRPVGARSLRAGIALGEWFTQEAIRIYATLRETDAEREQRSLLEWIINRGGEISARDLYRSRQSRYPRVEDAEGVLDELVEAGCGQWIDRPAGPQGGRPTRIFRTDTDKTPENSEESEVLSVSEPETGAWVAPDADPSVLSTPFENNGREPGEEG